LSVNKPNFAPHPGQFAQGKQSLDEEIYEISRNGFRWIEDNWLRWRTKEEKNTLLKALKAHGISLGTFVPHHIFWDEGGINDENPDKKDRFIEEMNNSIKLASLFDSKYMTIVPGKRIKGTPIEEQFSKAAETIRQWIDEINRDVILLIEPHAPERHPDMLIQTIYEASAFCDLIARENVKILFDTFHIAAASENLLKAFNKYIEKIGYVQLADYPGRYEPGTGKLPIDQFIHQIISEKPELIIGMEHGWSDEKYSIDKKLKWYQKWI
jgi:sugar phosphate isomerase/epimerase